jgi:hypothetical protein
MPSLIKAFKQMRRRGLIAKRECYCQHCSEEMMLEAAKRWSAKQKEVFGFVHLGEWDSAPTLEQVRIPLVFGSLTEWQVLDSGPDSLAVGEIVAECLNDQGIRYEWKKVPGTPILLKMEPSLAGVPGAGHHHRDAIPLGDNYRAVRTPRLPESSFDRMEGNPVRLLNLATLRRLNVDVPYLHGPVQNPCVGDHVKLGFLVADAIAPHAREQLGDLVDRMQLEAMWVEVTSIAGKDPHCVYRGELLNVPHFIDSEHLRIGSPVTFTAEQVYPAEEGTGALTGR